MAKDNYRYINTKFWDDNYVVDLDPSEKLLFIYFLTNPLTNLSGIYEISFKRISFDTGFDKEMIEKMLARFSKDFKIFYIDGYVYIRNFTKNQKFRGAKLEKALENEKMSIPDEVLTNISKIDIPHTYPIDRVSIPYGKDIDKDIDIDKEKDKGKGKNSSFSISKLLVDRFLELTGMTAPDGDYKTDNLFLVKSLVKKITKFQNDTDGVKKEYNNDEILNLFTGLMEKMNDFHKKNATSIKYINYNFNKIINTLK